MTVKTLRRRLFELVLVSTIPVLIFAMGVIFLFHRLEFERQVTRITNYGQAISLDIDNDLRSWIGALEVLGSSPHLDTARLKEFHDQAARALATSKQWNNIALYDAAGYQVLNLRLPRNAPVARVKAHSKAVEEALLTNQPVISNVFLGRLTKKPTLIAAVPAIRDGKIKYVMTCGVSPDFLMALLKQQRIPHDWRVSIIDRAGNVLTDSQVERAAPPSHTAIDLSKVSVAATFDEISAEGTTNLVGAYRSELSGWIVTVRVPKNNLTFASWQALLFLFGAELVLICGGITFAIIFGRRIAGAITNLADLARTLGRGELVHTLPSQVVEIDQVSDALRDASLRLYESRNSLLETKERLRLAMEGGNIGTWRWNVSTGVFECSQQCRKILNLAPDYPTTLESMCEIWDPNDPEGICKSIHSALQQKIDYEMEHHIIHQDGRIRYILVRGHGQYSSEGQPSAMNGIVIDETDRKETAERLREKDRQFLDQYLEREALLTAMPLGVAYMDRDMRFIRVNERLAEMNGKSAKEHVGLTLQDVVPQLAATLENIYKRLFESGMPIPDVEISGATPAHPESTHHWLVNFYPIRSSDGSVKGACAVVLDITARKEAEAKTHRASQRSKHLAQQLLHVQEASRRRLARELHDEFGQALTGLKLALEAILQNTTPSNQAAISGALSMVTDLIAMTRDLSLNLRPPILDDFGLLPALSWYTRQYFLKTRVSVNFRHQGLEDRRFPHEIETAVFRIIQEALTNVARHAHVVSTDLQVTASDDELTFVMSDQGDGFEPTEVLRSHHSVGLSGMQERAELVNGELTIRSSPRQGTQIIGTIPLRTPYTPQPRVDESVMPPEYSTF